MKILMVTRETRSDQRYGLGRSLAPLVEELRRRGIDVDYLCQADLGQRALLWQIRIGHFLASLTRSSKTATDFPALLYGIFERFNMGRLAAKLAIKQDYTHVHCHDPLIAAGLRFFLRFNFGSHVAWGVTEHGYGCYAQAIHEDGARLGRYTMRWMRNWEAKILLSASWVIAPTHSGIAQIARDLGISAVPSNWYQVAHARPKLNHYGKEEARNRLGWSSNTIYLLAIGRIAPVKQFPLLIQTCARLKIKKDFQLVILGEGNHDDLQKLAQQLSFPRKIIFAITEDIGLYLCAADLYISASASESFGMANLEALTAGTAAICTAVGGVPEVVGDGAFLAEPDLDSLSEAIQRMLNDKALCEEIAQKGQLRAQTWPDIIHIADIYEEIYRKVATS
jgi:glycosyltransferase involved in cell wall biosynthesis